MKSHHTVGFACSQSWNFVTSALLETDKKLKKRVLHEKTEAKSFVVRFVDAIESNWSHFAKMVHNSPEISKYRQNKYQLQKMDS